MKRKRIINHLKHEVNKRHTQADNATRAEHYEYAQVLKGELAGLMIAIIMLEDKGNEADIR